MNQSGENWSLECGLVTTIAVIEPSAGREKKRKGKGTKGRRVPFGFARALPAKKKKKKS